jgi:hypothetical protein
MTVRQIIQEIEALSVEQRREVLDFLQKRIKDEPATYGASKTEVRYLDHEVARPMIREILTEHAELFRKLSQ